MKDTLLKKIETKNYTVGVVGMGYVGLPLVLCFVEKGIRAIGIDIDQSKVDILANGKSYIKHILAGRVQHAIASCLFTPTTDFSKVKMNEIKIAMEQFLFR